MKRNSRFKQLFQNHTCKYFEKTSEMKRKLFEAANCCELNKYPYEIVDLIS